MVIAYDIMGYSNFSVSIEICFVIEYMVSFREGSMLCCEEGLFFVFVWSV